MSCDITRGRAKSCKVGIGGVSKLYLFNFLEDSFTVNSGVATAMNASLTEAFVYDLVGDGQVLVEDMVSDRSAGTTTNTQTTTAILQKIDVATSAEMKLIANGYPIAVVLSKDGNYHLVGQEEGIDFVVNSTTGTTQAEFNGYTLTGTSTEKELGAILDSSTVTAFLAVVTAN
jgi:hypothetical protein